MEKNNLKAILIGAAMISPQFIFSQNTNPPIEIEEVIQFPVDVEEITINFTSDELDFHEWENTINE